MKNKRVYQQLPNICTILTLLLIAVTGSELTRIELAIAEAAPSRTPQRTSRPASFQSIRAIGNNALGSPAQTGLAPNSVYPESVAWSRDGSHIAVGYWGKPGVPRAGALAIWARKGEALLGRPQIIKGVTPVALSFSPNNQLVALLELDGQFSVYKLIDLSKVFTTKSFLFDGRGAGDCAFLSNDLAAIAPPYSTRIYLLRLGPSASFRALKIRRSAMGTACFNPWSGRMCASFETYAAIFDIRTDRFLIKIPNSFQAAAFPKYTAEGGLLILKDGERLVCRSAENGRFRMNVGRGINGYIFAGSDASGYFATDGDTGFDLWSRHGTRRRIGLNGQQVSAVAFDKTGRYLVVGTEDGTLRFYGLNDK